MTQCPTKLQCQELEIDYMLEELAGDFKRAVTDSCMSVIQEYGTNEAAVDECTRIVMEIYEEAGVDNLGVRQEDARLWYGVLTKPTYVVIGEDQDV